MLQFSIISRLILAYTVLFSITTCALQPRATLDCSAGAIPNPPLFGAEVISLTATVNNNWQGISGNNVCLVIVTITHPGTNDAVNNWVALPLTGWNGIFQGIGGGGYSAGTITALGPQTSLGYVAAMTDAGHNSSSALTNTASPWALTSTGNVNQYLLLNFAHRSLHEFTVIGKEITQSFYGTAAKRSYWNGCSTGGRQGLVVAQYYPDDYDGILAAAPAIQWNDFTPAQQWPYTVINNEGYVPPPCEFDAVVSAVTKACDGLDGLVDNIISAPALCNFHAQSLVNQSYFCNTDGTTRIFSQQLATVVDKIWQGPVAPEGQFLWYGLIRGANFFTLAPTTASHTVAPLGISDDWFKAFLAKDFSFNTANVSYAEFTELFLQSHLQYDSIMGSASPDLFAFKQRGGKMITWQGLADWTIFPQGTVLYYEKVLALDPLVQDFYRQFYAPGVGHCGGGNGVIPTNPIGQLRAWVENGTAPATLTAASTFAINSTTAASHNVRFQNLCPWPTVSKYCGGDANLASSYSCASNTGWTNFAGPNVFGYEACFGQPGWY